MCEHVLAVFGQLFLLLEDPRLFGDFGCCNVFAVDNYFFGVEFFEDEMVVKLVYGYTTESIRSWCTLLRSSINYSSRFS